MDDKNQSPISRKIDDAAADWFARRLRGLTPLEKREFEKWLSASRKHRTALSDVERNWQVSRQLAGTSLGRGRHLRRAPFFLRRSTHIGALGLAAASLVGIVSLGLVERIGPFPVTASAEAAVYSTRTGEIRTFTLADGTQLTLDTASTVRVEMDAKRRFAELRMGRVRVSSARDPRAFIVEVHGVTVEAGKATFDLSAIRHSVLAVVLKGSLSVRSERSGRGISLSSGQQTNGGGQISRASPSQEDWVNGILGFDNTTLSDALLQINRYNQTQVKLGNPDLGRRRITGGFRASDPSGFAQAIATMFHLAISHPDKQTIVLAS